MQAIILPSTITGTIQAPASKSSMQRACAAALVAQRETVIKNPGHSNDDKAALGILKALGCSLSVGNGEVIIDSSNSQLFLRTGSSQTATAVQCGESGLGIRMFAPILALSDGEIRINGEGSLLQRPMNFFDEMLPQLGVKINSNHGRLPLTIKGPLQPRNIAIDGSLSSQFLTGLLFAYAATGTEATISVHNLKSKPYIDLTLKVMRDFGLRVPENKNYHEFSYGSSIQHPSPGKLTYTVEGDWSGGAFLLVAGAIAGQVVVKGLDMDSTQADKKIMEALKDSGCNLTVGEGFLEISRNPERASAFHFDATDCPDLFPPLVALASYCTGNTTIRGVGRLAHKESNRAVTLQEEFGKMGVRISLQGDDMIIQGEGKTRGGVVHSHHDHRIAMACAVAGLAAERETVIEEADAINKSYPDFYDHLLSLQAVVSTNQFINQ